MTRGKHRLYILSALLVAGCANAPLEDSEPDGGGLQPADRACLDGYQVGSEGECGIPGIGPGKVETPDAAFEAPTLVQDQTQYFLNQEGEGKFRVYTGQTVRIGVRVIGADAQPTPGRTVQFQPRAFAAGGHVDSTLNAQRSVTNDFGVAFVEVTGAAAPETFLIDMSGDDTTGLVYRVDVVLPPEGHDPDPGPGPVGDGEPGDPGMLGGAGQCLGTKGTYDIVNHYEPGHFFGDGVFSALDTIHHVLSDPGDAAGDYIQDRIDGIWGAVISAAVRPVVDYLYHYIVDNYAPDWVQWMLILTDDITGILTELEIDGTMELGPAAGADCALHGTHRWEKLVFLWRAGCAQGDAQCGRYVIDMNQLGISVSESDFDPHLTQNLGPVATMEISQHSLQLNIGVAVIWFVQNVILPQRLNVNNFGQLLQMVLPCDAVGELAAEYVGGSIIGFAVAPFVQEACESGLEALGNWLMGQLADQLRVDTFPMAGQCKLRDTSGDKLADKIEEGRWSSGLQGDFTGQRR
jgi:hypothetical protein